MHGHHGEGVKGPLLVWTYDRRDSVARLAACHPEYAATDYGVLIHPEDVRGLLVTIKHRLRNQRREHKPAGQFVNLHRVRNCLGEYCSHLSLITLTCDASKQLAFLFGVDYLAPPDASAREGQLQQLAHAMQALAQTPAPAVERRKTDQRCRTARTRDAFTETWRCAGYIVSPSLFRMVRSDDGSTVELSEKQSRFIALLLGTKNNAGVPVYVERALTRQRVFATDPDSRINENDIDRLVTFFRQHFGRDAIGTKRGYGHILRVDHKVWQEADTAHTLSLLWQERPSEVAPTQS